MMPATTILVAHPTYFSKSIPALVTSTSGSGVIGQVNVSHKECMDCGAMVSDESKHSAWHYRLHNEHLQIIIETNAHGTHLATVIRKVEDVLKHVQKLGMRKVPKPKAPEGV